MAAEASINKISAFAMGGNMLSSISAHRGRQTVSWAEKPQFD